MTEPPAAEWRSPRRPAVLWSIGLVFALAAHGAALFLLTQIQPATVPPPSAILMMDLAPEPPPPAAPAPVPTPEPPAVQPPPKPVPPPERHQPAPRHPAVVRPAPHTSVPPLPEATPTVPPEATMPAPVSTPEPVPLSAPAVAAVPLPSSQAVTNWQGRLVAHLARFKRFPPEAQLRSEQGVVLLRLTLSHEGDVVALSIAHSSGHPDLDAEALAWIVRAEPLPAFPPEVTAPRVELLVPLRFTLQ